MSLKKRRDVAVRVTYIYVLYMFVYVWYVADLYLYLQPDFLFAVSP